MSETKPDTPAVRHNPDACRYEIEIGGHFAVAEYAFEDDGRMVFTHTFVPSDLRGRGLAEKLVRHALADARTQGRRVVPACSYVAAFIARHAEFQTLLA